MRRVVSYLQRTRVTKVASALKTGTLDRSGFVPAVLMAAPSPCNNRARDVPAPATVHDSNTRAARDVTATMPDAPNASELDLVALSMSAT